MKIGNYKIESDTMNITLFERKLITGTGRGRPTKRKVGEEYYTPIAYFSTPQNALDYLMDKEVMGTGMNDFKDVIDKQNELYALIRQLQGLPQISK